MGIDRVSRSALRPSAAAWLPAALALGAAPALAQVNTSAPVFTEEAVERGIELQIPLGAGAGKGAAFADLDGDRDADLVLLGAPPQSVVVLENDGTGHFVDRSATSGIPSIDDTSAVIAGDFDGDRDLDLYVTTWGAGGRLLENRGAFRFADVTAAAGLVDTGRCSGPSWGDFDGDAYLDLYVANFTTPGELTPNRLFRNRGNGTFVEVGAALGVDDDSETWQSAFFDYDLDGDADLYVANDKGTLCLQQNYLFRNDRGSFVDVTDESGTAACIEAMCIAIGDFDANLHPDIYCTNMPFGNKLFLNQGDGVFLPGDEAGVESYAIGWGAVFLDYDNDGHQDLYVCNQGTPNRLYVHGGAFPALDLATGAGVATPGASYCVATADIDHDGDLDMVVTGEDAPVRLYVNTASEEDGADWVEFDVVGQRRNHFAVGAQVKVRAGGRQQVRQVIAGSNFKSQNDLRVHFGLGHGPLERVRITWPGGTRRNLRGYLANRAWALYPPERLGDADGDGDIDLDDFAVFLACQTGSGPGLVQPGCEMMDFDGDGDVDEADRQLMLTATDSASDI